MNLIVAIKRPVTGYANNKDQNYQQFYRVEGPSVIKIKHEVTPIKYPNLF
jgi:hypothetical protein